MKGMQKGFSLIEAMLAVSLIAIVFVVALPAYQDYVREANMARVNSSYENALRLARTTFVKGDAQIALGLTSTVPKDSSSWIAALNPDFIEAPGGGLAYQEVEDSVTGVVGVEGDSSAVTISRPEYWGLVAESQTIRGTADSLDEQINATESVSEANPDG